VVDSPALEEFKRQIQALRAHPVIAPLVKRADVYLGQLKREDIAKLLRDDAAYYFLLAAAGLNRTSLKKATVDEAAQIVPKTLRRAFAVEKRLPVRKPFADVANAAVVLRRGDLERRSKGEIEQLFRERLDAEGIALLMSPPVRQVPGILIGRRKPDGVYPDPASGISPAVYFEIKNVRRVADDIQKRLYEIAEASLEMKLLYGSIELRGLGIKSTFEVIKESSKLRARLREQIRRAKPLVVVLMLCSRTDAERYREGAEAFIDRLFFQEEIEDCLQFLRQAISK
jgi:hypothetical protein